MYELGDLFIQTSTSEDTRCLLINTRKRAYSPTNLCSILVGLDTWVARSSASRVHFQTKRGRCCCFIQLFRSWIVSVVSMKERLVGGVLYIF